MKPVYEEMTFNCGKCGYYENTGCPEGEGFCVRLDIRVEGDEEICMYFEEV